MTEKDIIDKLVSRYGEQPCKQALSFIEDVYNPGSDMVKKYPDLKNRKTAAMKKCGLLKDRSANMAIIDALMTGCDELLNIFIVDRCRWFQNRIWTMIVSNEQTFYEYEKILLSPVTEQGNDLLKGAELKGKLMDQMHSISERLEVYYKQMFPDDDALRKATETRVLNPEAVATMIAGSN